MAMAFSIRLAYRWHLFAWLVAYSVLLVGCFVVFQYVREKKYKVDELNMQLQLVNRYIIGELSKGADAGGIDLSELYAPDSLRLTVIAPDGMVVFDNMSVPGTLPVGNHLDRNEISDAVAHGTGFTVRRRSESMGGSYFYAAMRADNGTIVRTAVPYTLTLVDSLKADNGFLWFMGLVMLTMCMLGYFATRRVGQHISRLNRFAGRAEAGERILDDSPYPHDELGEISNHIVRLYARLQQALIDRDREHMAALGEQRDKERLKKQLTNNINHELKTPVASIRVCLETLLSHPDMDDVRRRDFILRCQANADRLKRLLDDVAVITRMDDGGRSIVREPLSLSAIIADVVADHEHEAHMKGMVIDCQVDGELPLTGNHTLLASVFHNLISNAIAYSGGSVIRIRLAHADCSHMVLTVDDNGSGVDECHILHLFERFYRVDKGRSRAAGGTGLGLAIVKNAILVHGGSITVANRVSGGLAFTITLPLNADNNVKSI